MIKGHSDFVVTVVRNNNKVVISKKAVNGDGERLARQMIKQQHMYNNNIFHNIKVPKILTEIVDTQDNATQDNATQNNATQNNEYFMEFIYYSDNVIDFLNNENMSKFRWFIDKLIYIIDTYIDQCVYKKIEQRVLIQKIHSVRRNVKNTKDTRMSDSVIEVALKYLEVTIPIICNIELPMGLCHGDLTFSNILIDNTNMDIYLIDFLDSFIETPMLDIVKIRQDTKYHWTLNMYDDICDHNKVIICYDKIDYVLDHYFSTKYPFYTRTYVFFQTLNILRVLQYAKTPIMIEYLIECLYRIVP